MNAGSGVPARGSLAPISCPETTCRLPASNGHDGFGGIYAALELEKVLARHGNGTLDVTLVTRDNFFLFTPMLHEVAASDLELNTIVNPLRKLLRRVNTFVGSVEAIDLRARQVRVSHGLDRHTHDLP